MTRRGLLVLLPIICALVQGCVSVPPAQPRISCAVWESVHRNRVFDSCVTALHLQGYTMQATDSTLGVIDSSRGDHWDRLGPFSRRRSQRQVQVQFSSI